MKSSVPWPIINISWNFHCYLLRPFEGILLTIKQTAAVTSPPPQVIIGILRDFMSICCIIPTINIALQRGQKRHSERPSRGMSILHVFLSIYYPSRHLCFRGTILIEIVSWPTDRQSWCFVTVVTIRIRSFSFTLSSCWTEELNHWQAFSFHCVLFSSWTIVT